jgi:hypothetical protein
VRVLRVDVADAVFSLLPAVPRAKSDNKNATRPGV